MSAELKRLESRLIRIEQMLKDALTKVSTTVPTKERLTEKEAIAHYGVSKHVLRRLRMGYKKKDHTEVPPMIFNWGHRNHRDFDYCKTELDNVLTRKPII